MAKTLIELRQQRKTLMAEFETIVAAEAGGGTLTAQQETRLGAIKGEVSALNVDYEAFVDGLVTAAAEATRAKVTALEIISLCAIDGRPAKAAHVFISKGMTEDDVRDELQADRGNTRSRLEDTNPKRAVQDPSSAASWERITARAVASPTDVSRPGAKAVAGYRPASFRP